MMKRSSFYREAMWRRKIRIAGLAAAWLAGAAFFAPAALRADSAPDWLRAAAQDPLPQYPKDTVAVILVEEQLTNVKDKGDIETRYRCAYKLLRPQARDDYGAVIVPFNKETKLTYLKAWTISPGGAVIEMKEKDAYVVTPPT